MIYKNSTNMSLLMAVWAIASDYDGKNTDKSISATTLLNGTKITVLSRRADKENLAVDLSDLIPSAYGSSIHASIEKAWKSKKLPDYLTALGLNDDVVKNVKINPKEVTSETIPIYLEQRAAREINGWTVNGQFDAIVDGQLMDNKSMSVYGYLKGTNKEKFIWQGSIYRWLNQDLVKEPSIAINYIFTDWSRADLYKPDYPKSRILTEKYLLHSLKDTEKFISDKLAELDKYMDADEKDIPPCTNEDLWRDKSVWKVYKDMNSPRAMSGGVKETYQEAITFQMVKGGVVKEVKGQVKRCLRCPAFNICKQRKEYFTDSGELINV